MGARARLIAPYAAVLSGAAFLYAKSADFAALGRPGQLGPDFWPKAVLVLLMVTCAIEIMRLAVAAPRDSTAAQAGPAQEDEGEGTRNPLLLAGGIGLTVLYVPGMEVLGFFLATAIYLAAFMVVGQFRRYGVIAITSLAGSVAFVFVFMKVVYVSLPLGIEPFKSVSTALMALLGIH